MHAQDEKKYVREGNRAYEAGKYKEAEDQYRKSVETKPDNYTGAFNLGDAYYKQGKYKEAASSFEEIAKSGSNDDRLTAKAYHNLGNALLKDKKYEDCIQAYRKSLTLNPKDDDTRYNLSYAQQKLLQQQNKDKKDKDNNKDKKDKDKKEQKKDDDKNKDKSDQKDPNKDKPEESNPNQLSKGTAQKMLNQVNNNDRKVQNKLKKQKETVQGVQIEKDW